MPTYRDILTQTCELLEPYASGRTLEEGTDLLTQVGLDSIQAMEVLLAAEGRFDMSIPLNVLQASAAGSEPVVQQLVIVGQRAPRT